MEVTPGAWIITLYTLMYLADTQAQTTSKETDIKKCCQRKPNSTLPEHSCVSTRLLANQFQNSIVTPGFPQPFPPDTYCKWEVHAPPGKRIWLDFRNLDLISKEGDECKYQKLIIRSPLTGLSMGPYCGHDGLPNVVSTGNHLIVELQSPYSTEGRQYSGFKMVYMETVQSTSQELRPIDWSDGMYINSNKDPFTRPSRFRPTTRTTPKVEVKPSTTQPTSKKAPKRKTRPSPVNRISSQNIEWSTPYPVQFVPMKPPPRTNVLIPRQRDEGAALGTEGIVGIIVGSIVAVAIISVIVAKVSFYRSEKRMKKEEEEISNAEAKAAFQKPTLLPNTVRVEYEKKTVQSCKELTVKKKRHKRKITTGRPERGVKDRESKERRRHRSRDCKGDERAIRKKNTDDSSNSRTRPSDLKRDKKNINDKTDGHSTHPRSKRREHRKKEINSVRKESAKKNSRSRR